MVSFVSADRFLPPSDLWLQQTDATFGDVSTLLELGARTGNCLELELPVLVRYP